MSGKRTLEERVDFLEATVNKPGICSARETSVLTITAGAAENQALRVILRGSGEFCTVYGKPLLISNVEEFSS